MADITELLHAARAGDDDARVAVFTQVYGELLKIARARLAAGPASTLLDAPSLVHEVYLRLGAQRALPGTDRGAFLAYASTAMRNLIFDLARERRADKRGGGALRVTLVTAIGESAADERGDSEIGALDDALAALAEVDARLHRVVELRYFGGLELTEVAELEGRSLATVKRDWARARAFLFEALQAS